MKIRHFLNAFRKRLSDEKLGARFPGDNSQFTSERPCDRRQAPHQNKRRQNTSQSKRESLSRRFSHVISIEANWRCRPTIRPIRKSGRATETARDGENDTVSKLAKFKLNNNSVRCVPNRIRHSNQHFKRQCRLSRHRIGTQVFSRSLTRSVGLASLCRKHFESVRWTEF